MSCCQRSNFAFHFVCADVTAEHCAFQKFVHAAATCSKHCVSNIALEAGLPVKFGLGVCV